MTLFDKKNDKKLSREELSEVFESAKEVVVVVPKLAHGPGTFSSDTLHEIVDYVNTHCAEDVQKTFKEHCEKVPGIIIPTPKKAWTGMVVIGGAKIDLISEHAR